VLISAPNQYQGTKALSTGVAHPCDMDRPQVAFSFALLCGLEGFDGRRDQSRHSDTSRDGSGTKSMKVTRSLVSIVDDDESARESLPDLLKSSALRPVRSDRRKSSSPPIASAKPDGLR